MNRIYLAIGLVFLMGCEGDFPGDRPFQLEALNGPYRIHLTEVEGETFLAVLNTNYQGNFNAGSIHFYDISSAEDPELNSDLSVKIPSNVSDFYYFEPTTELYLLDRNENQLISYQLDAGIFEQRLNANGEAFQVKLFTNPQAMVYFERGDEDDPYLAITAQTTGTIQFYDINNEVLLVEEDVRDLLENLEGKKEIYYVGRQDLVGARLDMKARTERITSAPIRDFIAGVSGPASVGRGINQIIHLSGDEDIFVTASFVAPAIFGFHLETFDNASNLLWELPDFEDGYTLENTDYPGTKASGFRSLVKDGDENIYLSSRSDNSIYSIPGDIFRAQREVVGSQPDRTEDLNTSVFRENKRPYRIAVDFDSDPTDEKFPRLSAMAVNNKEAGTATRAYVIGLESEERGFEKSRIYLVDLDAEEIIDTYEFDDGSAPQQLYLLEAENILYVASTGTSELAVFDISGDDFELVGVLGASEE